jgi:dTDP-4-dehydrorhamnose 3,5-epimerase-like enzyme
MATAVSQGIIAPVPACPEVGDRKKRTAGIIDLPKIADNRGNLTFIEGNRHVPFTIRRTYYLYDVPAGASRGGHAHKGTEEFIIAASGSFTVVLDDGRKRKKYFLNRPHYGLYVPTLVWRELENFSSGSICLVVASEEYDESDYYREYEEFHAASQGCARTLLGSARRISGTQGRDRRSAGPGTR